MSEKNESVAEVPAEGNSAGFFSANKVTSAVKSKRSVWPWAAVAATAIVAAAGGYAIGQHGGFDDRPAAFENQFGGQMPGPMGEHHKRGQMGDMMNDDDNGMMGPDGQRGVDPDGDNWTGTNRQPAPAPSSSASKF